MPHDLIKRCPGRRKGLIGPGADLCHGQDQICGLLTVFKDLPALYWLWITGENVAAELAQRFQPLGHDFDTAIVFTAPAFLQRLDQGIHFAAGFFVFQGQQHPCFDVHQMGGHSDKFTGHFQVHPLTGFQPLQILIQDL